MAAFTKLNVAYSLLSLVVVSQAITLQQFDAVPTHNCSGDSLPCGPGTSCCPSGYICNLKRGIPACENLAIPLISGYGGPPCADPYLNDCSILGVTGSCCPIGTVCFHYIADQAISCIDAYGTTASSFPSSTMGVVPSATSVAIDDPKVLFSNNWNTSSTVPSCTSNKSLRVTSTINSTISFNYTGPSVMVRTVTSQQGGVFAIFVDDFNTTDVIDTFSGSNTHTVPECLPTQYPPFTLPPPTLKTQNQHSIKLMYVGPSPNAPNGTKTSTVQFDSFAIPEFKQSSAISIANSLYGIFLPVVLVVVISAM